MARQREGTMFSAKLTHDQKRLKRLFFSASLAIYRRGEGLEELALTIRGMKSGMTRDEYVESFDAYWASHRRNYSDWYAAGLDSAYLYEVMWTWAMSLEAPKGDVLH
ncbi:MAG TPA: hypothetical protein DDY88_00185 [Actinobacteria bacterium]|nr:hypothetical protein [Actinomycetota bacterium]